MKNIVAKYVMVIALLVSSCRPEETASNVASDSFQGAETLNFFKDKIDFNIEDVKNGKVCGSVKNDKVSFIYKTWPNNLKKFLSSEISKFEYIKLISPHLEGVYLVEMVPNMALGLTCHDAKTNKYVVFFNNDLAVANRDYTNVDVKSYIVDGRQNGSPFLESRGDGALHTLIHEMFHVLDLALYWDNFADLMGGKKPNDSQKAEVRRHFYETTWKTPTQSVFENVLQPGSSAVSLPTNQAENLSLAGATSLDKGRIFSSKLKDHIETTIAAKNERSQLINLDDDNASQNVSNFEFRLKNIEDKTNFTSDFATGNFIEDFAVTLAHYYIGTRYNIWEKYEFFAPLKPYIFTPKNILGRDSLQRQKTCELVKSVLNESCRLL